MNMKPQNTTENHVQDCGTRDKLDCICQKDKIQWIMVFFSFVQHLYIVLCVYTKHAKKHKLYSVC